MSLSTRILQYSKNHKELFLPYLWDKWGVEPEKFTKALCEAWHLFKNPRMVNNLLTLETEDEPLYYEIANKPYNRGDYIPKSDLWQYCIDNQKEDQHVSVFAHDEDWIENFESTGSVSCRNTTIGTDYIYLELDRDTIEEARQDALTFYAEFPYKDYITLWHSGNKSYHIQLDASLFGKPMGEQANLAGRGKLIYNLAHKTFGDIRHRNGIVDPWNMIGPELKEYWEEARGVCADHLSTHEMKQSLENIDPNLFSVNSLIRQPYSEHEKGGKRKLEKNPEYLLFGVGNENIFDIEEKISYINTIRKPHLIHWVYDCYQLKRTPRQWISDVDEGEIIKTFTDAFKYFDPRDANAEGWVNGLYSPFYEDTNNDVSVNIKTGFYHDFGNPDHSLNFKQFKEKINERRRS